MRECMSKLYMYIKKENPTKAVKDTKHAYNQTKKQAQENAKGELHQNLFKKRIYAHSCMKKLL